MADSLQNVERELARLRMDDEGAVGLRASVLNLIVVADEGSAAGINRTISELADRHPSRAIVLIPDPEDQAGLDISLSAFCSLRRGANRNVCSEQVTVRAEGPTALHLESVAGPLRIPDLPTFLFYPGRFSASSPEFLRLADRVILDSAADCERTFGELERLIKTPDMPPAGDLQWAAISPWRALLRELFGSPDRRQELLRIREVEVMRTADGECRALLLAGWLSSSLGWTPKGSSHSETGRELLFEGPSGEITLRTSPSPSDARLAVVTLRSEDCVFRVSRHKELSEARLSVELGDRRVVDRSVRIGRFDLGATLGEELKYRGRDETFERSLEKVMEILRS
ncbi:MAG: glucose-6-phosphate dehydrogenase assembly protein OpcA [Rubrobacteraceae bacterium]